MELDFTNRIAELKELEASAVSGGLLVVFGRRRVGKTRLLTHWIPVPIEFPIICHRVDIRTGGHPWKAGQPC